MKSFMSRLLNNSKRLTLMYIVLLTWIAFGIFGIYMGTELNSLSVYFSSLGIPFIGYVLGETFRPSGSDTIKINKEN